MIRLAILGWPYVSGPTGPVPVPAKAIGLLAYLALHPESQPRERVIEVLWPERASLTGRKLLRNLLWRLRQDLVDEIIVAREDWLALGTTVWVDVREFIRDPAVDALPWRFAGRNRGTGRPRVRELAHVRARPSGGQRLST